MYWIGLGVYNSCGILLEPMQLLYSLPLIISYSYSLLRNFKRCNLENIRSCISLSRHSKVETPPWDHIKKRNLNKSAWSSAYREKHNSTIQRRAVYTKHRSDGANLITNFANFLFYFQMIVVRYTSAVSASNIFAAMRKVIAELPRQLSDTESNIGGIFCCDGRNGPGKVPFQ